MAFGQWHIDHEFRDVIDCDCVVVSRCGCVNGEQVGWALDMDDDDSVLGVECVMCGATWVDEDDE